MKALCTGQLLALIPKFEPTGTSVPLQCHPEVVRPNVLAELAGATIRPFWRAKLRGRGHSVDVLRRR